MMRPLDWLGSIKLKLGALVAVSVIVASWATVLGLYNRVRPELTILVAIVLALLVTQLLARGMTSPLREMTAATRAMATGDYTRRVRASSQDEVGELARAFNTMAAELASVDQQRRDLVANVSHELRTPVSALRAVLENLVDGVAEPDPRQLRAALSQTERLGRLVSDLLDLSRVDAGSTPLDIEPVAAGPFLRGAVAEARLTGRPVEFLVQVEPSDLVVHADSSRLHQLVANLLDNASRHSPPGGTVVARASTRDGHSVIEVADDGPGIEAAQRTNVFERFTSREVAPGVDDGGTGLGLAIARWVADLHGGSIEVAQHGHTPDRPGASPGCTIRARIPERTRS